MLMGKFITIIKLICILGVQDYTCFVQQRTIETLKDQFTKKPAFVTESNKNLTDALTLQQDLPTPSNINNALTVFCHY